MRWAKTDHIAIALSGGVDSSVLYHMLSTSYKDTYQSLTIFHVNHGVRVESKHEQEVLERLALKNGHVFLSIRLELDDFTQQKGRTARYQFFSAMMESHGIDYCLTAHHADDDVETILHELLSTRHLYGVGIKERHGKFLRPMLHLSKVKILDYAKTYGVLVLEDVSNERDDYTRNYIRHNVVPAIDVHPSLSTKALLQFKEDFSDMDSLVTETAKAFLKDKNAFNRDAFNELNKIVKLRVLSILFNDYIERAFIEECVSILERNTAQAELSKNDFKLVVSYDTFTVKKIDDEIIDEVRVISSPGKYKFNGYTIDVELVEEPITVRTRRVGDRILLPNLGTKKVNRIFIDKKIPNHLRDKMPIIVNSDGQIIAVGPIYNIIKSFNHLKFDIKLDIKE